jgi:sterol desaturase/sphingolipid hydroxylase (fatty acid hydroxylase superfamily)
MGLFPKPSAESPPMFESAFIDQFSRTHWSIVPILFVPASLILMYISVARADVGYLATVLLVAGGFLSWTFTEYWLHRTTFHWVPNASWGERFHFLVHGVHHNWPRDAYRLVMPPAVSITLFWFFLGLYYLTLGDLGWAFTAGFALGYMNYDCSHYFIQHISPKTAWGRNLRKHHLAHHSPKYADSCKFGVSTTLWDHVFRTYELRAGQVGEKASNEAGEKAAHQEA